MTETLTAVRERPILFSGPMVRALLNGTKTQTRRVVKVQPAWTYPGNATRRYVMHDSGNGPVATVGFGGACEQWRFGACPYGPPGDRLWVRETWAAGTDTSGPLYRADALWDSMNVGDFAWAWKPSIHMPRRLSRLLLEITAVRVERVQDISENDARAEGVEGCDEANHDDCFFGTTGHRCAYERLWDSLNASRGYGWDANPWVWVVEFRVASPQTPPHTEGE